MVAHLDCRIKAIHVEVKNLAHDWLIVARFLFGVRTYDLPGFPAFSACRRVGFSLGRRDIMRKAP
jgi:hypothetical protein